MITKDKVQSKLIDFLCCQFLVEESDIELEESLIDTGIIDSMGLIEIAFYIEKEYSFKVTEVMMNSANFGSVYKIVDFITNQSLLLGRIG
ncbi:acyl carrier protein [Labilibaculum antarcticum]|uniref:Acyl carrier protein n=1 Tax=Labilibaculum antarcticum TaxID=1717717 RepID=A0A1Y1CQR6_9BACT|nr:acyl carrier protein [Labilibaculum antarcticum]BAX82620.1 acyl carrier protein [Labilibaculum antarcticum]